MTAAGRRPPTANTRLIYQTIIDHRHEDLHLAGLIAVTGLPHTVVSTVLWRLRDRGHLTSWRGTLPDGYRNHAATHYRATTDGVAWISDQLAIAVSRQVVRSAPNDRARQIRNLLSADPGREYHQAELARRIGVGSASMSLITRNLAQLGWVTVQTRTGDPRRYLSITPRGIASTAEMVTCRTGDAAWTELLGPVLADPALLARMWADAEATPDELAAPGTTWVIATVHAGDHRVAAAWAGAIEEGETLKPVCSYEVPAWRGHGLYARAYAERHRTIVEPWPGPAVTYVFADPLALHLADGWTATGEGDSEHGHHWYELRRPASRVIRDSN